MCYNNLFENTNEDERYSLPAYGELLHSLDMKTINYSSIWGWLKLLGFNYSVNKRYYYTDGHERPDVVKDRGERFVGEYFKHEILCRRWIQISETNAALLEEQYKNFPKNVSYNCINAGVNYRKYPVDTHKSLFQLNQLGICRKP